MADYQITCIDKLDRLNPHERIQSVGLSAGHRLPTESVIQMIKDGHRFWVVAYGKRVDVVVDRHNYNEYIRTVPDDYRQNNLLSLPQCT